MFAAYSDYYFVPLGYVGIAVTCAGHGLPPWMIEWNSNGLPIQSQAITFDTKQVDSLHFSANLLITQEFTSSDVGNFSCVVRTDEFTPPQIKTISLRPVLQPVPSPVVPRCSALYGRKFFQIRILNVPNCDSWGEELKLNISRDFELTLRSGVSAMCDDCTNINDASITSMPRCSVAIAGAIVFWGAVSSQSTEEKNRLFCAISSWQQSSPEIRFREDSKYYQVDHTCPVEVNSTSASGCEVPSERLRLLFISTATIGGPILGVLIVALYIGITVLQCRRIWRKR